MKVIDLTLDDDEAPAPPAKRPRVSMASPVTVCIDCEDSPQRPQQQTASKPAGPAAPPAVPEDLPEDQDLLVTCERGDVATRDWPHNRQHCALHKFVCAPVSGNSLHCDKCYCYICDCPVSQCSEWGTGSDPLSHCHAHPGAPQWVNLHRLVQSGKKRREQQQAQGGPGAAAGPSHGMGAAHHARPGAAVNSSNLARRTGDSFFRPNPKPAAVPAAPPAPPAAGGTAAKEAAMGKDEAAAASSAPRVQPPPAEPLWGKLAGRLPTGWREKAHPSTLPRAAQFATLKLPVQAMGCSIAYLQQRLSSTGYEHKQDGKFKGPAFAKPGMYYLDNLTDTLPDEGPTHVRRWLSLLPLRQAQGLRSEADLQQLAYANKVVPVQLARDADKQKLVVVGVRVPRGTSAAGLFRRLAKQEGIKDCNQERLLCVAKEQGAGAPETFFAYGQGSYATTKPSHLWAFRLPVRHPQGGALEYAVVFLSYRRPNGDSRRLGCLAAPLQANLSSQEREDTIWQFLRRQLLAHSTEAAQKHVPKEMPSSMKIDPRFVTSKTECGTGPSATCWHYYVQLGVAEHADAFIEQQHKQQREQHWSWGPLLEDPVEEPTAATELIDDAAAQAKAAKEELVAYSWMDGLPQNVLRELRQEKDWAHSVLRLTCPDPEGAPDMGQLEVEVWVQRPWPAKLFAPSGSWIGHASAFRSTFELVLMQSVPQGQQLLKELAVEQGALGGRVTIPELHDKLLTGPLPSAEQPPGLAVQLLPYQRQTLWFMQQQEDLPGGFADHFYVPVTTPGGETFWYSPVWRYACAEKPMTPKGGFLAEAMGMGKTVECLALLLSRPAPADWAAGTRHPVTRKVRSRGTLVVCSVSLVGQWEAEMEDKLVAQDVKVYKYHGSRTKDMHRLAQYDLVITTYGVVASDCTGAGSKSGNPLADIHWHRVIFDEGQTVKNAGAKMSRACAAITADRRWSCSGTPVNTSIDDLAGQFSTLQMAPISDTNIFKRLFKHALENPSAGHTAQLMLVLHKTLVRHTKEQKQGDQPLLALPAKSEQRLTVALSEAEQAVYMELHNKVAAEHEAIHMMPDSVINTKILQLLGLLTPLRQYCSGGSFTRQGLGLGLAALAAAAAGGPVPMDIDGPMGAAVVGGGLAADGGPTLLEECPVCFEPAQQLLVTPCNHLFCRECITATLEEQGLCPLCRTLVHPEECKLWQPAAAVAPGGVVKEEQGAVPSPLPLEAAAGAAPAANTNAADDTAAGAPALGAADDAAAGLGAAAAAADASDGLDCTSKLKALMADLSAALAADGGTKALVFSQYSSSLGRLEQMLTQAGIAYRTIRGCMSRNQRTQAIKAFQGDPAIRVFLLSVRAGAVGITLTAARLVYLLEPCLNPSLEAQAIGRAWRLGQQHHVTVKRLVVQGSVEERILEVRAARHTAAPTAAAAAASSSSPAAAAAAAPPAEGAVAAAGSSSGAGSSRLARELEEANSRLAVAAAAGSVQADKQALRAAELAILFKQP